MSPKTKQTLFLALASQGINVSELVSDPFTLYRYLADLISRSPLIEQESNKAWDYRSIVELAERDFIFSRRWVHSSERSLKPDIIFKSAAYAFANNVNTYAYYVNEGLPLYVKTSNDELRIADNTNQHWQFLTLLLKEGGYFPESLYEPPNWTRELYIKRNDLRVFGYFYFERFTLPNGEEDPDFITEKKEMVKKVFKLVQQDGFNNLSYIQAQEKPLKMRERRTLLVLIAALARALDIDISQPQKAAQSIQNLSENIGVPVDHQTIANKLKEIPEALEARGKIAT